MPEEGEFKFKSESFVFIDQEALGQETLDRLNRTGNTALLLVNAIGERRLQEAMGEEYRVDFWPPDKDEEGDMGVVDIKDKGGFYEIHCGGGSHETDEKENRLLLKTGSPVMKAPANTLEEAGEYFIRARASENLQLEAAKSWLRQMETKIQDAVMNFHSLK